MRLTSTSVQRLLNASERALVESVSASALTDLTAARLRSKVERTRRLRDKYATQARARGRTGRGKAGSTRATPRTDRETMTAKVEVFEAVLTRLTGQLEKVERREARDAARHTRTSAKTSATRTPKKTATKAAKKRTATAATKAVETSAKKAAKSGTARTAPRRTSAARATATKRAPAGKATPRTQAAAAAPPDTPPITKGEAREIVARVKRRVAETTGDPAAIVAQADETAVVPAATEAANTSVEARSHDARAATVEQHFAATHIARAQGHAGGRTQRAQGKRDS